MNETGVKDPATVAAETINQTNPVDTTPAEVDSDEWKDFDFSVVNTESKQRPQKAPLRENLIVFMTGVISGAAAWLIGLGINKFAMNPLFCQTPDTAGICQSADRTSFIIGLCIAAAVLASVSVVRRVNRGIIVAVAVFITVGALWPIVAARNDVIATVIMAVFSGLLLVLFSLISGLKKNTVALLGTLVAIAGFWLLVRW
jgi:hypothetical protein